MSAYNHIGIIGTGKMGKEIFTIFHDEKCNVYWIPHREEHVEEIRKFAWKLTKRLLKYAQMDLGIEDCMSRIHISADYKILHQCDLIVETVTEKLEVKRGVFEIIEGICSRDCVFTTNTSSLPLSQVFKNMKYKDRCMGLHFFFPTKLIRGVEINVMGETNSDYADKIQNTLQKRNMKSIILKYKENMVFSRLILDLMSESYLAFTEGILTIKEIDQVVQSKLMINGIFEILDSTGLPIVYHVVNHFINDRNREFHSAFKSEVERLHQMNLVSVFSESNQYETILLNEEEKEKYKKDLILRLKSILINEITLLLNTKAVTKSEIDELSFEILGLHKKISEMVEEMGTQTIICTLEERYGKTQFKVYEKAEFEIWHIS